MTTFLVSIGIGLSTAAILSLSAVAFTLEYAVSRIANFAHGEFLTIGAYAAYSGQTIFHQNVAAAAVIPAAAGAAAGLAPNSAPIHPFPAPTALPPLTPPPPVGTTLGFGFLLPTIPATVAGGIGRTYATFGGALIVGLVLQIAGTYTSSAYQLVYAFLLLVLLMLFRPNGVFVRRSAVAVRA